VTMRSYTADCDDVFITELSSPDGSPSVTINIDLAMPAPDTHTTYPTTVGAANGTIVATRRNNLTGASDFHSEAAIAVRTVGHGFDSTSPTGSTATGSFTLDGGSTVQLATLFRSDARAGGGAPSADALASQATTDVESLTDGDIAAVLSSHRDW